MNGYEALEVLREGKKIRLSFYNKNEYIEYKNGQFKIQPKDYGYDFLYVLKNKDMDWQLYNEQSTFSDIKLGERFRFASNGVICMKVHNGYMNTTNYRCYVQNDLNQQVIKEGL